MANSSDPVTPLNSNIKSESPFKFQRTEFKPCLKHAVEIIAESPSTEKSSKQFCENCSQTMLSYIFLIQDALDNLARKICGGENKNCCLQCLRQESGTKVNSIDNNESAANISELRKQMPNELFLQSSSSDTTILQKEDTSGLPFNENNIQKPARKSSLRRNSRRFSREQKEYENMNSKALQSIENNIDKQGWKTDFLYDLSPKYGVGFQTPLYERNDFNKNVVIKVDKEQYTNEPAVIHNFQEKKKPEDQDLSNSNCTETILVSSDDIDMFSHGETKSQNISKAFLSDTHQVVWDNSQLSLSQQNNEVDGDSIKNNSVYEETSLSIESIETCKSRKNEVQILENSLITNVDHCILDCGQFATKKENHSEAFVTICRNNSEVMGCLVLACSLQLSRTSKTLCVLILDDVDPKFRTLLSSVFNAVETVSSMDSTNSTILTPLRHFLAKLNIWRLLNFSKCVFLNPDTMVIRNCDELFQCGELSAVPDTGWPDCFNTGVFVFVPSIEKFSELVKLAKKQGPGRDGEEMILNSFFDSWARDISKKLSFIYNLVDNASYTYASAFQRFGHNVKIVQFTGFPKPWQVKFCCRTDQISEETGVNPNFIRFFHEWISIFRVAVLRLLPQDISSKALSLNILSAEDILQFIESPVRNVIPNSPSHTSYEDINIIDSPRNASEQNKNIHTFSSNLQTSAIQELGHTLYNKLLSIAHSTPILIPSNGTPQSLQTSKSMLVEPELLAISSDNSEVNSGYDRKDLDLPGSVVGDYQGMKIWEQGQMDYAGCDNSENIIKRLQFLMDQPQHKVSGTSTNTKIAINQYI